MNKELLYQIIDVIAKEPKTFDMSTWGCGTTACIGGWALRLTHSTWLSVHEDIHLMARRVLELSDDEARRLFYTKHWPESFKRDYVLCYANPEKQTDVAIRRIRHFIATDGRE